MTTGPDRERGATSVEHAALVLLMALAACAVIALFAVGRGDGRSPLASAIAFKQRCAVRYPKPCWQDSLTEAYGRGMAGAVRALAPAPRAVDGLVGVDYRHCRQASCAIPGPLQAHLTTSNRRTTAFTSIRDGAGGSVEIDYWIYRPTIGWEQVAQPIDTADVDRYAKTPLLDSADPVLVPLETLLGRDDARFRAGEEPPWRGEVESRWGR